MKKYAVFALGLVFVSALSAQLPSGAQAPDFTATDLNGQTWNLYDLLASDKIVVLDDKSICEMGTHAELMELADGLYRRLYSVQRELQPIISFGVN